MRISLYRINRNGWKMIAAATFLLAPVYWYLFKMDEFTLLDECVSMLLGSLTGGFLRAQLGWYFRGGRFFTWGGDRDDG